MALPPVEPLQTLREVVRLGYPRGVERALDALERECPQCQPFVQRLRDLAQRFQFDPMKVLIDDALERQADA
jgi:hypothetical protein